MKTLIALLLLTLRGTAQTPVKQYRHERDSGLRPSTVRSFVLSIGPQWTALNATKVNGERFSVWLLRDEGKVARRYIVQESSGRAREYRDRVTGNAVLPSSGAWEHLFPRPLDDNAERVRYLGNVYVREPGAPVPSPPPSEIEVVELRPDLLIGPASNTRQKDETRRYDGSDYELIRLTRADYAEMAAAGISCVRVDADQATWAHDLKMFYYGAGERLPYPELLYRPQYLGPVLYFDEPAVVARDYKIRPRLEKDPEFRKSITPQLAYEAFRAQFAQTFDHVSNAFNKALAARADADIGTMKFAQQNLYSWETMISTSAYQLSRDPLVPEAIVFEPPGRIGTRRTIPEMNMTYGVQLPPDDPKALTSILFGFLRGAARLTGKQWGVSIYGAVQQADTFWWLTHAYDLGATRFFFWDSAQLACVPYNEYLALARHLTRHAASNPKRDLPKLRRAAEAAILLPPGYNLGHVFMGRGILWGLGELNLERHNAAGVKYRAVMSSFFKEIERCFRLGIPFDLLWDLPNLQLDGYREVIRVREDGKVIAATSAALASLRPAGIPPELTLTIVAAAAPNGLALTAKAHVVEKSAQVYYTFGADPQGVYHNARVAWELYGPGDEDYLSVRPGDLKPVVKISGQVIEVEAVIGIAKPGQYRLRASTVDLAGRTAVVWRPFSIVADQKAQALRLQ
jgi:hypothetical protein